MLCLIGDITQIDAVEITCQEAYNNQDYAQAINLCKNEMGRGSSSATTLLGKAYLRTPAPIKDSAKAFDLLSVSAKENDSDALIELGGMYRHGVYPVKKDFQKAESFYRKSAFAGNPIGLANIGFLYLDDSYKFKPNFAYVMLSLAKERGFNPPILQKTLVEIEKHQGKEDKEYIMKFMPKMRESFPPKK